MLEDFKVDQSYEGGQSDDTNGMLTENRMSVGNGLKEAGCHYGRSVSDRNKYRIDFYVFQQCGSITTSSASTASPERGLYLRGIRTLF